MMARAGAIRWTAIAIAAAAVLDPAVPLPVRLRPALRVIGASADGLTRQLRDAGFALDEPNGEVATVLAGDAAPACEAPDNQCEVSGTPIWALDTSPRAPNVGILAARGPSVRLPGQAVEVRVTLEARGLAGKTSELLLEDSGIFVATARHGWTTAEERWEGALSYLPPGAAAGRLRVRIAGMPGETTYEDNAADVAVPPVRGPIRTLVVEAGVTWPAMFVRRAIEGEPAFAVAAVQRATTRIATRAGTPPAALTHGALAPFEVVLIGAPDNLTAGDVEALQWFVEQRGGLVVLIPDQRPTGRYVDLFGATIVDPRALEAPVALGQGLMASELLITRRPPAGSRTLAATDAGEPVVFSARRGAGAVIFSGALDAWRYRERDNDGFARFWRGVMAEEAAAVPPVLEVSVDPALPAAGEPARVRARLRVTELSGGADALDIDEVTARAVSPGARADLPLRLWPTAEPGVFEGQWRPSIAGDYDMAVTAGARRGDATVTVAPNVFRGSAADPEGLALAARTSGGRVFPADRSAALVEELKKAFPARAVTRSTNPMRSPWWVVPFAALLCAEWAVRRRRGLA